MGGISEEGSRTSIVVLRRIPRWERSGRTVKMVPGVFLSSLSFFLFYLIFLCIVLVFGGCHRV